MVRSGHFITLAKCVDTHVNLFNVCLEDVETEAQKGEATCPESHSK